MTEPVPHQLMAGLAPAATAVMARLGNPFYARAIQSQPGYTQSVELRDKAIQAKVALLSDKPSRVRMPASVDEDLDKWLGAVSAFTEKDNAWRAKDQALSALVAQCDANISGASINRETLITSLAHDLNALMAEIADTVEQLNGARTPTEVIETGAGDAWIELGQLRQQYDLIRDAQATTMLGLDEWQWAKSNYLWDDPHATDTAIANLDEVFPDWRDQAAGKVHMSGGAPPPQPWPSDPIEQLIWFITAGAKLWIPTPGQLQHLWTERRAKRNLSPTVIHGRPDKPSTQSSRVKA